MNFIDNLIERLEGFMLRDPITVIVGSKGELCEYSGILSAIVENSFIVLIDNRDKIFIPLDKIVSIHSDIRVGPDKKGVKLTVTARVVN
ncbi:hypothetical protein [Halonatronum saccharophilum]|uniref:hypothetical protein n=1 Tax=Halonatronum saccharophilum TaxID=150060 RepID=UPI00047FC4FD|nr:hypothetical protein [Halonatronum saccharophilum]